MGVNTKRKIEELERRVKELEKSRPYLPWRTIRRRPQPSWHPFPYRYYPPETYPYPWVTYSDNTNGRF